MPGKMAGAFPDFGVTRVSPETDKNLQPNAAAAAAATELLLEMPPNFATISDFHKGQRTHWHWPSGSISIATRKWK